ncbi:hypothetical protein NEISICOT_02012 [Neisseria sicca ATCC 29256]|uniref:Uncharacterized protein n=1 Tax=Neisseria sicca ATCC 29256 TaxID=547045 RepID=C6M661_NEISI|nr:hypothetical protein NEISICOT_02012 [Neisseria sicca ATCC 29256]
MSQHQPCPFPVWRGNDCRPNIRLQTNRKGRLKPGKPSFRRPFDFMARCSSCGF